MKKKNADLMREIFIKTAMNWFTTYMDQDCGLIASGTFNFPIVADDGEEGWIEICVKVPKGTKDEEYDGYARRDDYRLKCEERKAKAKAQAEAKAKKMARDKARREKESE